ncbi:hypothetical protein B0J12DRAFT_74559 [Macrophomina phaseolina]|uniref:Uncharacterized protein n=1 Tax=Macrophomina phaseolina TaxID=35725 RepID=A0ABQ8GBM4_9PEZI|nr:hypothetical protein B0J12DRAFT_74559 [Macrophomina phaseolina]
MQGRPRRTHHSGRHWRVHRAGCRSGHRSDGAQNSGASSAAGHGLEDWLGPWLGRLRARVQQGLSHARGEAGGAGLLGRECRRRELIRRRGGVGGGWRGDGRWLRCRQKCGDSEVGAKGSGSGEEAGDRRHQCARGLLEDGSGVAGCFLRAVAAGGVYGCLLAARARVGCCSRLKLVPGGAGGQRIGGWRDEPRARYVRDLLDARLGSRAATRWVDGWADLCQADTGAARVTSRICWRLGDSNGWHSNGRSDCEAETAHSTAT